MKRSVLTALVLPSMVAVMLGSTALSAPMASAAPVPTPSATAAPDEGPAVTDVPLTPVPDPGAPSTEATSTETAPSAVDPAPVGAEPTESAPTEVPLIDDPSAPVADPDEPSAAPTAPGPGSSPEDVASITAATEPGTVTISGTTEFGDLQTAVTDEWPEGTTFTYQWTRDGSALEGATAETYVLVRADIGRVVEVAVTGTGPGAEDEPTTVVSARRVAAGVVPTFSVQPGTDLTVVAGEPYSFTWEAAGDPVPNIEIVAHPSTLVATLPAGATVTQDPGSLTISGTSTLAGSYSFGVTPLNMVGIGELLVVDLEVAPAEAAGILVAGGTTSETEGTSGAGLIASSIDGTALPVSLDDGDSLFVSASLVDAFGNIVPAGLDETLVATDGQDDDIVVSATGYPGVTFHGPGPRVLTVSLGGFTVSIPVEVESTAVTVPAGADAAPVSSASSLAYTGSEPTDGLLALAAGLLAAGAALTVVRLRRRVQR